MKNPFVTYKIPAAFVMLLIVLTGAYSYRQMSTSLFPNITFPKIKVIVDNGQQPVDKMMVTITRPVEEAVKRAEHVRWIRSTTSMGSCELSAFLEEGSDIDRDKQDIESRISAIRSELPPGVQIQVEKMNPSILPVMGYSLQSKSMNAMELRLLGEYTIKPELSGTPGVAAVEIIGGKTMEYQVVLNKEALTRLQIDPGMVAQAIRQSGFISADGYVVDHRRLYLTVTDATMNGVSDLENCVVLSNPARIIRVKDLAEVKIGPRTEYVSIRANGEDVPLVAILKQPGANLIEVADAVKKRVEDLNLRLPAGVTMQPYYDQAVMVESSLKSIIDVLWIGLLLALVVVILFLRSWKASGVLLATMPVTLGLTFMVMHIMHLDLNIMTIGAMAAAIGLVIDDAVIVVEQIHRTHEEHPDEGPVVLTGRAIRFLLPAMGGSSLSTIVIFLPFVLMTGVAGAYFRVMTEAMIITLTVSFVVTWLGLPVLYLLFSSPHARTEPVRMVKERRWVRYVVERPWYSYVFLILLGVMTWVVLPKLPTGFLPEMDEGSIVLDFNSPPGTSLEATDQMLNCVDAILDGIPEVVAYTRRTGTQMGFFITEPNRGDYLIELNSRRQRTTNDVIDSIRTTVEAQVPALQVDFGQVIGDMLGDLMASVQPIEIKVMGADHATLEEYAAEIAARVEAVDGTADVFDGIVVAGPMITMEPRHDKLRQYGLTDQDLNDQLELYLNGVVAGSVPGKEQLTDIRVLYPDVYRNSLDRLSAVTITTPSGQVLPLTTFARIGIRPGVSEIEREDLQTMGVVTARLNNRDLGSVMADIRKSIATMTLPGSIHIEYGGAWAEQQQSFRELLLILILAGALVFTVILFMFRNLLQAVIVLVTGVAGMAGSILALYLTGTPLNVGSYTGIIMIIGIVGEASVFTLYLFREDAKRLDARSAIIHSVSARLRPKLMTALSAVVALTPLALGLGTGARMHQPLAIAVIGGFVVALPLLLVVLPTLLYQGEGVAE